MKTFETLTLDFKTYKQELAELKEYLYTKDELSENTDLLPFFRKRKTLTSQIATLFPSIITTDKFATEYDLFGDFSADFAIGDSSNKTYCFIEFEDAKKESIFVQNGKKCKLEFSSRLEHGFSQVIDWFYKLDNQSHTDLEERFGSHVINYEGILIIGRDKYLDTTLKRRLEWRTRHTIVNSKFLQCYTFDELYVSLEKKLSYIEKTVE